MDGKGKRRAHPKKRRRSVTRVELTAAQKRSIRHGDTIIDRAIAVAQVVAAHGLSLRAIATQCRMNPAMVTRLAGIGRVLAALPGYRVTRLRQHPAMTWKALQRVPTRGRDAAIIVGDLEAIVARGVVDGRKARTAKRRSQPRTADALLGTLAWLDDPATTGDDPQTIARAYRVHLRDLHERVGQRLRGIIARSQVADAGIPFAGQSFRAIVEAARTARRAPPSPQAVEAMRIYAEIEEGLGDIVRRH